MPGKFLQYGAGNIGRGFIGPLFAEAGWSVDFIDVNMEVINALNAERCYPLEIVSNTGSEERIIKGVAGIDGRDAQAVAAAIAGADIMATAVGVNILPRIAPVIAAGLRLRWRTRGNEPLNIIICENMLAADKYLAELIKKELPEEKRGFVDERVGLVEASVGRMVPVMTEEMKKGSPLRVCVERYCSLPVDAGAVKGELPRINGLHPFSPFEFYIERKLYLHNMGHALSACFGAIAGCEYIWQAADDPYIRITAQRAMLETASALSLSFGVPLTNITDHIADLLLRFENRALGDTVARVARDTWRKLSADDRFAGAIRLCEKQGIEPVYTCLGAAAALRFTGEDEGTTRLQAELAALGPEGLLKSHCGLSENPRAVARIIRFYDLASAGAGPAELLAAAEVQAEQILIEKQVI